MVAGAVGVAWFAVEGGEYGTLDIYAQRAKRVRLRADVAALHAEIDSLKAELRSVTTDDKRLERIAREQFGMVKGSKEILYWTTRGTDASGNTVAPSMRDSTEGKDTLRVVPRG